MLDDRCAKLSPADALAKLRADDEVQQQETEAVEQSLEDALRTLLLTEGVLRRLIGAPGVEPASPTASATLRELAESVAENSDTIMRQVLELAKKIAIS